MTIDEAIENEKRRAESCKGHYDRFVQMEAKEHKQIAEWLEELVMLRLDSCMIHMPERLHLVENGYNKALDDFVNQFNVIVDEKCGTDTNNYFRKIVKEVAEQLKESETE